jgi:hypothetical protein
MLEIIGSRFNTTSGVFSKKSQKRRRRGKSLEFRQLQLTPQKKFNDFTLTAAAVTGNFCDDCPGLGKHSHRPLKFAGAVLWLAAGALA